MEQRLERPAFDTMIDAGSAPQNYQRHFVPAIGAPLAAELVERAAIRRGERVLDVACGTGVVTRLAAAKAGPHASVAGLDVNPGMLAVARQLGPAGIAWYETRAEAIPLPDASFDVVLCGLGLQFMGNRAGALAEMRRVLVRGGRVAISLPGPTPAMFAVLAELLAKDIAPAAARFAEAVFSLHDAGEIRGLLADAGFRDARVEAVDRTLKLPAPGDFLWQYVRSTPLAGVVADAGDDRKEALDRDVRERWQPFASGDGMALQVTVNVATASR